MILPTDLPKNWKNHQNIINFQYFDEISKLNLTRVCAGISKKIPVNIGKYQLF